MTEPEQSEALPIVLWDHPVLAAACGRVEDNEFGGKLADFGRQMLRTMESSHGLGLAAPQVGVAKRIFVMTFPDNEQRGPVVACNPVLRLDGAAVAGTEGCLSLPGIHQQVLRAEKAQLRYRDPLGAEYELLLDNLDARVAQHEFDHTQGIMFFDWKDKREEYLDTQGKSYGPRMSKQMSKQVLRAWAKEKTKYGL